MKLSAIHLVLVACVIEGLYPVVAKVASFTFPPIFFVAAGSAIAAATLFLYLVATGDLGRRIPGRALRYTAANAFCGVGAFVLISYGTKQTSGINTSLLLQAEIVSAAAISWFALGERLRPVQVLGALGVLLGTGIILYNGVLAFNVGDLLILAATILWAGGTYLARTALRLISPPLMLFLRYAMALVVLLPATLWIESSDHLSPQLLRDHGWLLVVFGAFVLVAAKTFFYFGLRVLPMGQAVYITAASPAFSLLFAYALLGESPNPQQWAGFSLSLGGVYGLIYRDRVS